MSDEAATPNSVLTCAHHLPTSNSYYILIIRSNIPAKYWLDTGEVLYSGRIIFLEPGGPSHGLWGSTYVNTLHEFSVSLGPLGIQSSQCLASSPRQGGAQGPEEPWNSDQLMRMTAPPIINWPALRRRIKLYHHPTPAAAMHWWMPGIGVALKGLSALW